MTTLALCPLLMALVAAMTSAQTTTPNPLPVPGRSIVTTTLGIVAASQPLAAKAGAEVLDRGGNAIDAAIAANAVLGLVEPHMNGVGGDLFAIIYEAKTGRLHGLNASGWAPTGLTPQLLADRQVAGTKGLYVKDVDANGLMAEIRIPPTNSPALIEGDAITRINRVQVSSLADFQRVLNTLKVGDPVVLNVSRLARDQKGERLVPLIVQFTYQ